MKDLLAEAVDQNGDSLLAISEQGPVMLVFLRHFGCQNAPTSAGECSGFRSLIAYPRRVSSGIAAGGCDQHP